MLAVAFSLCLAVCSRCVLGFGSRFSSLNNKTFEVYGSFERALQTTKQSLVCTDPNAKSFGGFGNFMITIYGVQAVALMTGRVPVMNNILFTNMFEHPDPRQSWDLVAQNQLKGLQQTVQTRSPRCPDVLAQPLQQMPKKYGINGCLHTYLDHPQGSTVLANLIPLQFNTSAVSFGEQISGHIAEWSLSRPTANWKQIVDRAKAQVFDACGADVDHADLAVQFRTWRDVHPGDTSANDCHEQCAKEMAVDVQKHLNRPICVFVTSDNETATANLAGSINAVDSRNINAVYLREVNKQWHSGDVVASARWSFDSSTLAEHDELKIWMLVMHDMHSVLQARRTLVPLDCAVALCVDSETGRLNFHMLVGETRRNASAKSCSRNLAWKTTNKTLGINCTSTAECDTLLLLLLY